MIYLLLTTKTPLPFFLSPLRRFDDDDNDAQGAKGETKGDAGEGAAPTANGSPEAETKDEGKSADAPKKKVYSKVGATIYERSFSRRMNMLIVVTRAES